VTGTLLALGLVSMVLTFLLATIEESLWNVSRVRAEEMSDEGVRGSAALLRILDDRSAYLSVTTFLRVCFQSATTVFVTLAVVGLVDGFWRPLLVAIAVMVLVSFMLVTVSPRTLGRQHSAGLALLGAPFVVWLRRILGPLARLLVTLANAVTPGKGFRDGPFQSEAELRGLVDLAGANSLIEDDERAMIHSVFELGDTIAREVMVPRPDMVSIESDRRCRQAMSLFIRSGFSRVPVVGEGSDDILGMLYFKDLVRRLNADPAAGSAPVTSLMRPARFVPESKPVDDLMRDMQQAQNHVAIVVDE
jgi:CBS domain containing-hemolysin-like protein